jgi:hypothetical protein
LVAVGVFDAERVRLLAVSTAGVDFLETVDEVHPISKRLKHRVIAMDFIFIAPHPTQASWKRKTRIVGKCHRYGTWYSSMGRNIMGITHNKDTR